MVQCELFVKSVTQPNMARSRWRAQFDYILGVCFLIGWCFNTFNASAKMSTEWWVVRSDSGKWGQVPAKYLKEVSYSEVGYVTVHPHSNSPDIVVRLAPRTCCTQLYIL